MALNTFCFCFGLRRASVVFAWIQMMLSALGIAVLVAHYENIMNKLMWDLNEHHNIECDYYYVINYIAKLSLTYEVIKAITCVSLTLGLVKKNHMFYQPWLCIFGFENGVCTVASAAFIRLSINYPPYVFIGLIVLCILVLRWYLWKCIYIIYKRDTNPATLQYDDEEAVCVPLEIVK